MREQTALPLLPAFPSSSMNSGTHRIFSEERMCRTFGAPNSDYATTPR